MAGLSNIITSLFKTNIEKDIDSKLKQLRKIPRINNGGCAIVAKELATYINTTHNKRAKVVFMLDHWDSSSVQDITNNRPTSCKHAVVRLGRHYYDTDGKYTLNELLKENGNVTLHELPLDLVQASIDGSGWNSSFDRSNIPKIKQILKASNVPTSN